MQRLGVSRPCTLSCRLFHFRTRPYPVESERYPGLQFHPNVRPHLQNIQDDVDKIIGVERIRMLPPKKPAYERPEREMTNTMTLEEFKEAKKEDNPLIYLCDWEVKLIGPCDKPSATVRFVVPMTMTKMDVYNYLRLIYDLDVLSISLRVQRGALRRQQAESTRIVMEKDYKVAFVMLRDQLFKLPSPMELFPDHFDKEPVLGKSHPMADVRISRPSEDHFKSSSAAAPEF